MATNQIPETSLQCLVSSTTLFGGVKLERVYKQGEDPEVVCGKLSLWNQLTKEILTNSLGYYTPIVNGNNKFYNHITIRCYAQSIIYPDAAIGGMVTYAFNNGTGNSKITCPFTDPSAYWFKAAMSHEFGHCFHNWVRMYEDGSLDDVRRWWCHELTYNKIRFDPTVFPWKQKDGSVQNEWEQLANSFRILFGTPNTRGVLELVPEGMYATTSIPNITKKFQLLPELCAMVQAYGGIVAGTMQWTSANTFMFQIPGGYWIQQYDYNVWAWNKQDMLGNWSGWKQFSPSYTRD